MTLYRVWHDIDRDEEDAGEFNTASPDDAADAWCDEEQWDEGSPPDSFILHVRDTESGKLYTVEVQVDYSPNFYSSTPVEVQP